MDDTEIQGNKMCKTQKVYNEIIIQLLEAAFKSYLCLLNLFTD